MRKTFAAAAVAAIAAIASVPALAQGYGGYYSQGSGGYGQRPDYRPDPRPDYRPDYRPGYGRPDDLGTDRRDAVRAARREGLVEVDDVERRGPRWIVRGSDRRGNDMRVVVDARTGEATDVIRR